MSSRVSFSGGKAYMLISSFWELPDWFACLPFGEADRDTDMTPPLICESTKLDAVHACVLPEDWVIA